MDCSPSELNKEEQGVFPPSEIDEGEEGDSWDHVTDTILLHIFQFLSARNLLTAGQVCKLWNRVSYDEFLWRDLFYKDFNIKCQVGIMPGKCVAL